MVSYIYTTLKIFSGCMQVLEVDVDGKVLYSYTNVNSPYHLSMDGEGNVLVADFENQLIVQLNSRLQLQRYVVDKNSPIDLWEPRRLFFNEATSKLFVLHSSSKSRFLSWSDVLSLFNVH